MDKPDAHGWIIAVLMVGTAIGVFLRHAWRAYRRRRIGRLLAEAIAKPHSGGRRQVSLDELKRRLGRSENS